MRLRINLARAVFSFALVLGAFTASADEPTCLALIRKSLINPETLQGFDFDPLTDAQLDKFYVKKKFERDSAETLVKLACIQPLSQSCLFSKWKEAFDKTNAEVKAIEAVKDASDFRGFKMRVKAESRRGSTITSFYVCLIGGGKISTINIED